MFLCEVDDCVFETKIKLIVFCDENTGINVYTDAPEWKRYCVPVKLSEFMAEKCLKFGRLLRPSGPYVFGELLAIFFGTKLGWGETDPCAEYTRIVDGSCVWALFVADMPVTLREWYFFGDFFLRCQHPLSACEVCVGALVVSVCSLFLCKLCVFVCYIFFSRFSLLPFSVPSD